MTKKTMTKVRLGEIAEFINGGAWNQREYSTEGIPVVRVTNLKDETVDLTDCKFLPAEALAKYSKHVLRNGDLIISTVGSHPSQPGSMVGRPCIAPLKLDGALLNQNAVLIRTSTVAVDQGWLGYLGRSKPFRDYVIGCARGSANQVRMAIGLLKEMPVTVPPLDVQKRVASILGAYDDLIGVNRRRIALMEEMSRRLFEEWFVHFRFPGHEDQAKVETPNGPVPKGWRRKELGDVCSEIREAVLPADVESNTPYVGLEHIPRRSITLDAWGRADEVTSTKLRFRAGDVLFGKIRPYFHKVVFAPFEGVSSSDAIVIRSKSPEFTGLVLSVTSSDSFVAHSVATSNGTKMPRANWSVLARTPIFVPPDKLTATFSNAVASWAEFAASLNSANGQLAASRDLLLRRLLSDELSASAPASVLEAVA